MFPMAIGLQQHGRASGPQYSLMQNQPEDELPQEELRWLYEATSISSTGVGPSTREPGKST